MPPDRRPGPRSPVSLAALATAAIAASGAAQEAIQVVPDPRPAFVVEERQFNAWVFQNLPDADSARAELEAQVDARINDVGRYCDLSDEQVERLRLAARGDVERFFDRVEQRRDFLQGKSFDQDRINDAFQEIRPLQQEYQAGIFGEDSLMTKAVATILDPEQSERYDEALRERRAVRYQANVDLYLARLGLLLGLTDAQHDRLAGAIREGARPPRQDSWNYPYGQFLVLYQLSTLPEETIRPIFDDAQWRVLKPQLDQAARMAPALRANGLIDDEEGRE